MPIKRKTTIIMTSNKGIEHPVEFVTSDAWSAYENWEKLPENNGKTEAEYIEWLRGVQGSNITGVDTKVETVTDEPELPKLPKWEFSEAKASDDKPIPIDGPITFSAKLTDVNNSGKTANVTFVMHTQAGETRAGASYDGTTCSYTMRNGGTIKGEFYGFFEVVDTEVVSEHITAVFERLSPNWKWSGESTNPVSPVAFDTKVTWTAKLADKAYSAMHEPNIVLDIDGKTIAQKDLTITGDIEDGYTVSYAMTGNLEEGKTVPAQFRVIVPAQESFVGATVVSKQMPVVFEPKPVAHWEFTDVKVDKMLALPGEQVTLTGKVNDVNGVATEEPELAYSLQNQFYGKDKGLTVTGNAKDGFDLSFTVNAGDNHLGVEYPMYFRVKQPDDTYTPSVVVKPVLGMPVAQLRVITITGDYEGVRPSATSDARIYVTIGDGNKKVNWTEQATVRILNSDGVVMKEFKSSDGSLGKPDNTTGQRYAPFRAINTETKEDWPVGVYTIVGSIGEGEFKPAGVTQTFNVLEPLYVERAGKTYDVVLTPDHAKFNDKIVISGKVKDARGIPGVGVTVSIKTSQNSLSAKTDENGNFSYELTYYSNMKNYVDVGTINESPLPRYNWAVDPDL